MLPVALSLLSDDPIIATPPFLSDFDFLFKNWNRINGNVLSVDSSNEMIFGGHYKGQLR